MKAVRVCLVLMVAFAGLFAWVVTADGSPLDVAWTKEATNPVISDPGATRGHPCIIYEPGEAEPYVMYLSDIPNRDIYRSTSADGVTWSARMLVLARNTYAFWGPWVIKDGNTYEMWYEAHTGAGHCGDMWIEHATSADGINWTKDPGNPVLTIGLPGTYDDCRVRKPCVIKEGSTYKMWYTADTQTTRTIAYATSPDGTNWDKYGANPVLTGDGSGFDSVRVHGGGIYVEDGVYYLLYGGDDGTKWELGLAWSTDGLSFSRLESPIVPVGQPGDFDDSGVGTGNVRGGASMLAVGAEYWLWYGGYSAGGGAIGLTRGTLVAEVVQIDIKPGSCPNPLNPTSKGMLPVAILGTDDLDVTTIDPSTILLTRDGVDDGVPPVTWSIDDVGTPFEGELCDCHDLEADGWADLTLKFRTQEVVEQLASGSPPSDGLVTLTVTGELVDGTPFSGSDCVWVVPPEKIPAPCGDGTEGVLALVSIGAMCSFVSRRKRSWRR